MVSSDNTAKDKDPIDISSTEDSETPPSQGVGRSMVQAFKGFLRRESKEDREEKFQKVLEILRNYQDSSEAEVQAALEKVYGEWSQTFELLKSEFNKVWELFHSIEGRLPGWFCVSPCAAPWKAVGLGRGGYTFSACVTKNHSRNAPLSPKSLTVSFGLEGSNPGIGDERLIGRTGVMSDTLMGLEFCNAKRLSDKLEGARKLGERMAQYTLIFRMNHEGIGQQVARLPLSILKERPLEELCQNLFVLLNNDILSQLQACIAQPEKMLLTAEREDITLERGSGFLVPP